jgi:hypothetical protein
MTPMLLHRFNKIVHFADDATYLLRRDLDSSFKRMRFQVRTCSRGPLTLDRNVGVILPSCGSRARNRGILEKVEGQLRRLQFQA